MQVQMLDELCIWLAIIQLMDSQPNSLPARLMAFFIIICIKNMNYPTLVIYSADGTENDATMSDEL